MPSDRAHKPRACCGWRPARRSSCRETLRLFAGVSRSRLRLVKEERVDGHGARGVALAFVFQIAHEEGCRARSEVARTQNSDRVENSEERFAFARLLSAQIVEFFAGRGRHNAAG